MYRLLIADDEENIRNGIARSLPWQEWGYEVCAVCANGQEVLDHVLRIRVAAHHRGDKLILTVTDNGIGMDAETVEKLRQQIAHGRKPSAEKNRRSTGIGLHNIEARLRLYAGTANHVRVQSRPGFGTRVSIELPWNTI